MYLSHITVRNTTDQRKSKEEIEPGQRDCF